MIKVNTLFGIYFSAMCCLLTSLEFCNAANHSVTPAPQESAVDTCKNLAKVLDLCFIERYTQDKAKIRNCDYKMRSTLKSDSNIQATKQLFDRLYGEKRDGMKALLAAMKNDVEEVRIGNSHKSYVILSLLVQELENNVNWELPGDFLPQIGIWIFERNKFLIENDLEIPASVKRFQEKLMGVQIANEEERAFTNSMIGLLSKVLGAEWLDEAMTENGLEEKKYGEGIQIIRKFFGQRGPN